MTTQNHDLATFDYNAALANLRNTAVYEVDGPAQYERDITHTLTESTKLAAVRNHDPIEHMMETVRRKQYTDIRPDGYRKLNLWETFLSSPDAMNMLRTGVNFLSFLAFAEMPVTYPQIAKVLTSNKPQEEYLRDSILGVVPRVRSGQAVPEISGGFEGGVTIVNHLYQAIVRVTGDDIRFDKTGKIRQIAEELGRAFRMTQEYRTYEFITTTTNYSRNSTTNDNDIGANQATTTFSASGLETAWKTIATMKDRKSGAYLGLMPDTLIVTPGLQWPAKQLLFSDTIMRAYGGSSQEVRGTGTDNPYRGAIKRLIVTPWIGPSYQWALMDSRYQSLVFQEVEPFNVLQEAMDATSEAWMATDSLRYKGTAYFGIGFVDDRSWFYSDSTSAAAVS